MWDVLKHIKRCLLQYFTVNLQYFIAFFCCFTSVNFDLGYFWWVCIMEYVWIFTVSNSLHGDKHSLQSNFFSMWVCEFKYFLDKVFRWKIRKCILNLVWKHSFLLEVSPIRCMIFCWFYSIFEIKTEYTIFINTSFEIVIKT